MLLPLLGKAQQTADVELASHAVDRVTEHLVTEVVDQLFEIAIF